MASARICLPKEIKYIWFGVIPLRVLVKKYDDVDVPATIM